VVGSYFLKSPSGIFFFFLLAAKTKKKPRR
jgi:hypothetical protein